MHLLCQLQTTNYAGENISKNCFQMKIKTGSECRCYLIYLLIIFTTVFFQDEIYFFTYHITPNELENRHL